MSASNKPEETRKVTSRKKAVPKSVNLAKPDEMSDELIEFITAIDEYKRSNQRPFPTWSEVLDVLKSLGYERPA